MLQAKPTASRRAKIVCLVLAACFCGAAIRPSAAATTTDQSPVGTSSVDAFNRQAQKLLEGGNAAYRAADFKSAAQFYTELLKLKPGDPRILFNRGNTYLRMQDPERALLDFSEAIRLEPDFVQARVNRGNIHLRREQFADALADYNRATAARPNDAFIIYHRAVAYQRLGDRVNALSDYSRSIDLNPTYAPALSGRGLLYLSLGQRDEARRDLNSALRLNASDARAVQGLERLASDEDTIGIQTAANPGATDDGHALIVEAFLSSIDDACFKNGEDVDGLRAIADQQDWRKATGFAEDADLVSDAPPGGVNCDQKRPSCRHWLAARRGKTITNEWTGTTKFGKASMVHSRSPANASRAVCTVRTEGVSPHLYSDISSAFSRKYGAKPVSNEVGVAQIKYWVPHRKNCDVETLLKIAPEARKLTVRMTHGQLQPTAR
jgi:tetratricopeptide (TPR) repeat protein